MATGRFLDWVPHQHEIGSWRIIAVSGLTIIDIYRYGLKILNNLQLESQTDVKAQTSKGTKEYVCFIGTFADITRYLHICSYHYSWPYTDNNAGDSIKDWVKVD